MVKFAFYETTIGLIKIGCEEENIVLLKKVDTADAENEPCVLSDKAFIQLIEYLNGKREVFDLPLKMKGTPFQIKVWNALCEIPYGETRSYKDIAEKLNNPKASRAVGMAIHNNPLWIVVPCHRVVGTNGKLTGYAGGLDMKLKLLELEKSSFGK